MIQHLKDTSRLDDYRREERALFRAAQELRFWARHPEEGAPPSPQGQKQARERALGLLMRAVQ